MSANTFKMLLKKTNISGLLKTWKENFFGKNSLLFFLTNKCPIYYLAVGLFFIKIRSLGQVESFFLNVDIKHRNIRSVISFNLKLIYKESWKIEQKYLILVDNNLRLWRMKPNFFKNQYHFVKTTKRPEEKNKKIYTIL
jgi:hypothetical protein